MYVPHPGVTAVNDSAPFDTFGFRVSDCEVESAEAEYTLYHPTSAQAVAALWRTEPVVVRAALLSVIEIPVRLIAADQLVGALTGFTVQVLGVMTPNPFGADADSLAVYQLQADQTVSDRIDLRAVSSTTKATGTTVTNPSYMLAVVASRDVPQVPLLLSIALNGYAYRLVLAVSVDPAEPILIYSQSSAIDIALYIVGALMLCLVAYTAFFVVYTRAHPVIRASSPFFCLVTLLGFSMAYALVMTWASYNISVESCVAASWYVSLSCPASSFLPNCFWCRNRLGHLGFCIAYGALFSKTYRTKLHICTIFAYVVLILSLCSVLGVNLILNQDHFRKVSITDLGLFARFGVGTSVMVVYLIIWSTVDPPRPTTVIASNISYLVCKVTNIFDPLLTHTLHFGL
jgi:hypothetical protein